MLEPGLYTYITTALPTTTFYALRLPQKNAVFPSAVYKIVSTTRIDALGKYSGLSNSRVEFQCWANKKTDAMNLAESLRLKLDGFSGSMGSVVVDNCFNESQFDMDPEPLDDGSNGYRYRVIAEYRVIFAETIPSFS